jgi:hypothetical protein
MCGEAMSLWDLRQWMESATPWWAPLVVAAIVGVVYLVLALRR